MAATDVVVCVCFLGAWLFFAGLDAVAIGHAIWGEDSPAVDEATLVGIFAASSTICFFSMLALSTCIADSGTKEGKAPASRRSPAAATREFLSKADMVGFLATMAFFALGSVGGLVKVFGSVKGSRRERIGIAIMEVGFAAGASFCCLIAIPTLALRAWRMRRSGWSWYDSCEKKPSGVECSLDMGKEPDVPSLY